jgi:Raf kinase inhibitor-like YbhB/YbcL family protein
MGNMKGAFGYFGDRWRLGLVVAACGLAAACPGQTEAGANPMKLRSSSFENGRPIPPRHTGDGADVSPPLFWSGAPVGTKGFALICDDPDAPMGTWVHWIIYGLPADAGELPQGVPAETSLPNGAMQGLNDFHKVGYGGPLPPPGRPHHYFFKLYALDTELTLVPRATKPQLLQAMQGHILAEAQLMGTYRR